MNALVFVFGYSFVAVSIAVLYEIVQGISGENAP